MTALPLEAMPPRIGVLRETGRYLLLHLPHLVLAPCLALTLVTFLHELAHAAAALVQGAAVTEFRFLPTQENFGQMRYEPPPGAFFVHELVSLAPYLMWSCFAAVTACIALFRPRLPYAFASTLFVWFYVVPLLDIAMAVEAWVFRGSNDLASVFGAGGILDALLAMFVAPVVWAVSFLVQKGLYGERALSAGAYGIVSALGVLALLAAFAVLEIVRLLLA